MILCGCGCGKQRAEFDSSGRSRKYIHGHYNRGKCFSEKHVQKMSDAHVGKIPWNKGLVGVQIFSNETKEKMKNSHLGKTSGMKGKVPWNKGVPQTEEHKRINSESHKGQIPWNWKGGKKLKYIRNANKRKRELGFNPINEYYPNLEGHHINKIDVIFVPINWNHMVPHNIYTGKNMDVVNSYAFFFIVQQNIQNLNSYFSEMKG